MATTLDRTWYNTLVDDSGGAVPDGTIWSKSSVDSLMDTVDAALAANINFGGTISAGTIYINDTADANMTTGLVVNQGAADDEALALKSSDVAHGVTTLAETDTYAAHSKVSATGGGAHLTGLAATSDVPGLQLTAVTTMTSTTKSTAVTGAVNVVASRINGTGVQANTANTNLVTIRDNATTRFIFDADGDSHQDVGTAWTNFDTHDDVAVLNLLSAYVTRPDDPVREAFGHWLLQSRETLERLRLVTFNDDGHHFVNMSRLTMLLVGAVRQMGARLDRLERMLGKECR